MSDVQSQLARVQTTAPTSAGEIKALGARAWEEKRILVVAIDELDDPMMLAMAEAIGKHIYRRIT